MRIPEFYKLNKLYTCMHAMYAYAGSIAQDHMDDLRRQIPSTLQTLKKLHQNPKEIHLGKWLISHY